MSEMIKKNSYNEMSVSNLNFDYIKLSSINLFLFYFILNFNYH